MRRIGKCRKSDACLEATEKVSIVRHFLIASKLRWYGKPRFSCPRTVALATTMCRNSDELAVGNWAKFYSEEKEDKGEVILPEQANLPSTQEKNNPDFSNLEQQKENENEIEILWKINFDGSCSKLSAGAGVWIHNTKTNHAEGHSYKLNFPCTNNIAEYEALLLGLQLLKKLGAKRIAVHGDSQLVIR